MTSYRKACLLSAAAMPLMLFSPTPAMAQAGAEEGAAGDIIVTARRREESLLDVPVSVSAFAGDKLEAQGVLDITDIGNLAPNMTLEASRGTNSTLTAFIRGVGQQDPVAGFEQGVGIYLDDVYLNRPQAAVLDIYDVERIEVLRGPQGTLYGRNTIGGAIKYVTKRLPDHFELKARASYGNYDLAEGVASVAVPLSDMIRIGGSVARLSRGGFGRNLTLDTDNYNKDVWAGRATLEIGGTGQPGFIRISGDYTHDRSNARGGHRLTESFVSQAPVLKDVYDTRGGLDDPKQDVKAYGLAAHATAELSDALTLKSISAWRKDKSATPIDFDALPAVDLDVPAFYNNEQISQEVQLQIDTGPFHGLIGAYYLNATAQTQFDTRLFTSLPDLLPGLSSFTDAHIKTRTTAVFADFTYDVTEQFSLSVGGRYTWDKRDGTIFRQSYVLGGSPVFGGPGLGFGAPDTDFSGSREYNKFTPRVSLSFKPSRDHMIYAGFSQGFKGGGFDPRGLGSQAPDGNEDGTVSPQEIAEYLAFEPETVDSYEIGYKGALFDRRLNLGLALFRMDYKDVQIPGSAGCVVNGVPNFCGIFTNAGKARFQGVEFEFSGRVARDMIASGDMLNLSGALGYIDAKYKEYVTNIPGVGPVDVADHREVQNTPKWTMSGSLGYSTPVGDGRMAFNTTLSYRSKTYQFEIPNPYLDQKGYMLWDASLVYTAPSDRWTIGVHGKNLANKRYKTSGYTFMAADPVTGDLVQPLTPSLGTEGTLTTFYGNPRQVFATLGVKF
ncbi:MAG: TonB-dependent receptor [Sphingobium sp.]